MVNGKLLSYFINDAYFQNSSNYWCDYQIAFPEMLILKIPLKYLWKQFRNKSITRQKVNGKLL